MYLAESKDFYQVVGVLKFRNASAAVGGSLEAQDFASDIYIPISTLRQRIGDTIVTRRGSQFSAETVELNQITIRVRKQADMKKTAAMPRRCTSNSRDGGSNVRALDAMKSNGRRQAGAAA